MEQKISNYYVNLKKNKIFDKVTRILFPLLIVAYAFVKVNKGGDISDTTYSYSNFVNIKDLDSMWYYSTFYANLLGRFFVMLPFGRLMLGLNTYTGIVKVLLALSAYYFFCYEVKFNRELVFLGTIVSVGLCWCPTATLYNYLTYLLFFLGCAFLYRGLIKERGISLIIAGFMLGSNVFVRLPNLAEAALIVVVWIYGIINKESFIKVLKKTGICILGYLLAFIPALLLIVFTRGIPEYIKGINELFMMTDDATSYSTLGMILSIVRAYIAALRYFGYVMIAGIVAFVFDLIYGKMNKYIGYSVSGAMLLLILLFMYKKNIFNRNYHTLEPVYRLGSVVLIISVIILLIYLFKKTSSAEERVLSAIAGVCLVITPIGSNNEMYSNLNNMFFIMPVLFCFLIDFGSKKWNLNTLRFATLFFLLVFSFQSIMLGFTFIFRDGTDGKLDTPVNNDVYKGMRTTDINAKRLEGVSKVWRNYNLKNKPVLLYGDCSGLGFYLESPIAISTAWPSLSSFSTEKFETEMKELSKAINEGTKEAPPVIVGSSLGKPEKQEILNEFLDNYFYKDIYTCDMFTVYLPED